MSQQREYYLESGTANVALGLAGVIVAVIFSGNAINTTDGYIGLYTIIFFLLMVLPVSTFILARGVAQFIRASKEEQPTTGKASIK